jgi:hypothetical protein
MNTKDFDNILPHKMSNDEKINLSIANSKMTEAEWTNFNNFMNNEEYDESALIKTFVDFVIVIPTCQTTHIGSKPEFTMILQNYSERMLKNHCADITDEKEIRLPNTITELVEWTEDIYRELNNLKDTPIVPPFHIYMNQNNDKFMCLVRLWEKFRWMSI